MDKVLNVILVTKRHQLCKFSIGAFIYLFNYIVFRLEGCVLNDDLLECIILKKRKINLLAGIS